MCKPPSRPAAPEVGSGAPSSSCKSWPSSTSIASKPPSSSSESSRSPSSDDDDDDDGSSPSAEASSSPLQPLADTDVSPLTSASTSPPAPPRIADGGGRGGGAAPALRTPLGTPGAGDGASTSAPGTGVATVSSDDPSSSSSVHSAASWCVSPPMNSFAIEPPVRSVMTLVAEPPGASVRTASAFSRAAASCRLRAVPSITIDGLSGAS
mmetsp:Transcript_2162/g.7126  ORF Transcript_2162/g.7126 Transcript_2162/m.7126 type:complete len:209 (+) Transcript_2162:194-820(+)